MANIEVASVCNLKCPYCFAEDHMSRTRGLPPYISLDVYEERLDFLDRSGIDQVRLIGGEPTRHPAFPELIRRARLRDKRVMVFSHGLMSEAALSTLEALSPDLCAVLINTNAMRSADGPTPKETAQRLETIMRLGPRILLGYNIYKTNFDLRFLLPIILEAGCRRAIRVGLAHPTVAGENDYLHPKQYRTVGEKLVAFCQTAAEYDITLDFDCGFVRCMFTDDEIDILQQANADYAWRCSPILDVNISSTAIHCFPLAGDVNVTLANDTDASDLRTTLAEQTQVYRAAGIYRECTSCVFKMSGECSGGGLEHILRRFRHTPFRVTVPIRSISTEPLR